MFDWARKLWSKATGRMVHFGRSRRVRGGYEAEGRDLENQRHWEEADNLSANAHNDPAKRERLRNNVRLECRNSGPLQGLVETMANDLIGTGPRQELAIPGISRDVTRQIENAWHNWSLAADYPEDLRMLERTEVRDGECPALMITNPALTRSGQTPITLDLAIYEAEQVADPMDFGQDPLYSDGIRRDRAGNPVEYTFLENHPGGVGAWKFDKTITYPAHRVLHWFKADRPGQSRGITCLAPGLRIGAQRRRYALAVLGAAEVGAMLAGVLKTNLPAVGTDGKPIKLAMFDTVEMARQMLLTLPQDWDAQAFQSSQPTQSFKEFNDAMLAESGRGACAPRNIMTGDSSPYNFSSAKLDSSLYRRVITVKRSRLRHRVLDPMFLAWVHEAILAQAIPANLPPVWTWSWKWHFDGFESIDSLKDAQTDEIELRNGTTTLTQIYTRKGEDAEIALEQMARLMAKAKELGLVFPWMTGMAAQTIIQPEPAQEVANAAA